MDPKNLLLTFFLVHVFKFSYFLFHSLNALRKKNQRKVFGGPTLKKNNDEDQEEESKQVSKLVKNDVDIYWNPRFTVRDGAEWLKIIV